MFSEGHPHHGPQEKEKKTKKTASSQVLLHIRVGIPNNESSDSSDKNTKKTTETINGKNKI